MQVEQCYGNFVGTDPGFSANLHDIHLHKRKSLIHTQL